MIVLTILLFIKFRLTPKQKGNCRHNYIPFDKKNINICRCELAQATEKKNQKKTNCQEKTKFNRSKNINLSLRTYRKTSIYPSEFIQKHQYVAQNVCLFVLEHSCPRAVTWNRIPLEAIIGFSARKIDLHTDRKNYNDRTSLGVIGLN